MHSRLTPSSWIYLLVHALVFFVGVSLMAIDHPVALAVATSLMATGLAGWVVFFWVRQNEVTARSLQNLAKLGIVDGFHYRSVPIRNEYEPRFLGARREISIMGFGLRALREDFGSQFASWAGSAKVRILLIDPDAPGSGCSYADQRDAEEGNHTGSIRSDVEAMLRFTERLRREQPENFQIRLYTCIPSINVCVIDDEAFWGPFLSKRQSRNTMTLLCRRGGHMYAALAEHFEAVWSDPALSHPPED
ncbi:hypothetical protein E1200_16810 [Actinomadura sp. GC306]|uniref:hypothetical protein n=1 Tax=Actinomadura sp. GC306 TaxID=2530367 RepID=UPI00104A246F|nr:hypothetical protein [Actinomadura sp. GC306]TDC66357.1 hypothetical protein E1200_16810 [Actinomadura sp. GC306]